MTFIHGCQQAVQPQRCANARQLLASVDTSQIVIASSTADAADGREGIEVGLEDDARVVIEAPGN